NLGVTSSSEDLKTASLQDSAKKKDLLMADNKQIPNDDWLKFDPLGFDMMDDELDESLLDSQNLADDMVNTISNPMANTDMLVEQNHSPYNTSEPMRHTDMPDIKTNMDTEVETKTEARIEDTDTPTFDGDTSRANPYFIPLLPKPIHRHESDRQLIMDTETTGLDPMKGDRIIEVGIVELVGRKFTGEKLHVYINPQRGVDEEVIRIHGISEALLR